MDSPPALVPPADRGNFPPASASLLPQRKLWPCPTNLLPAPDTLSPHQLAHPPLGWKHAPGDLRAPFIISWSLSLGSATLPKFCSLLSMHFTAGSWNLALLNRRPGCQVQHVLGPLCSLVQLDGGSPYLSWEVAGGRKSPTLNSRATAPNLLQSPLQRFRIIRPLRASRRFYRGESSKRFLPREHLVSPRGVEPAVCSDIYFETSLFPLALDRGQRCGSPPIPCLPPPLKAPEKSKERRGWGASGTIPPAPDFFG